MIDIAALQNCVVGYTAHVAERHHTYSDLLARADSILKEKHELDRLRPPNFNIFLTLGHAYREVSTHSAMLAHLLEPAGNHAQKALFLSNFLDIVGAAAKNQKRNIKIPKVEHYTDWRCRTEEPIFGGFRRADIILRGPGLIMIIENKIGAGDREGQLQSYWQFANAEARQNKLLPVVVYLTPRAHRPSDDSVGNAPGLEDNLVLLSYRNDICEFICRSVASLYATSVAEVLRQYVDLVRTLQ